MREKTKFFIQYYLNYFIKNFFFLKIYLILLLNQNLSVRQTSLILSIYGIASLLIEIPNGALTDYFGYKKSILFSMSMFIVGYLTLLNSKNFLSFCIFYICFGLYETIFYTAKEILFYNNIKHLKLVDNYPKYKSISRVVSLASLAISSIIAGKITKDNVNDIGNINLVIIVDVIVLFINLLLILSMKEYRKEDTKKINKNYFESIKNGFKYVKKHKTLMKLIFFEMLWYPLSNIVIIYSSLIYKEISPVVSKNFAISLMISTQILSIAITQTFFVSKMSKKSIYLQNLLFVIGAFCSLLSFYVYRGLFSYLLNILYLFFTQSGDVLSIPVIYDLIPKRSQACIVSMMSFLNSIAKVAILYVLGLVSGLYNYRIGFMVIFSIYSLCCVVFFIGILLDKHFQKMARRRLAKVG